MAATPPGGGPAPRLPAADTLHEAVSPDPALARRNLRLAWALLGVFVVLFGGAFLVAFAYLWLD